MNQNVAEIALMFILPLGVTFITILQAASAEYRYQKVTGALFAFIVVVMDCLFYFTRNSFISYNTDGGLLLAFASLFFFGLLYVVRSNDRAEKCANIMFSAFMLAAFVGIAYWERPTLLVASEFSPEEIAAQNAKYQDLCRADCYLCKLTGIGHWCNGHIAYHEHTVFAIALLLRYEKHGSADARNAWGTLDNLQCRTQSLARCRERTADLSVGIAGLYDHAAKVERVLHKLAGLFDGHSLPLAQLSKQLCILLALGIVVGIDDCSLANMGQSPLFSQAGNLFRIAYKDDVGHLVGQNPVGSPQCTLLGSFGEHDALLSSFSACYDLL